MKAHIITIGDEILIGQIVDTNSAWLAQTLNASGINVIEISSISDSRRHIFSTLDAAKKNADLIILTGGLGPTDDDITKSALAAYFGTTLVRNPKIYEKVKKFIERYGFEITENNARQADIPASCIPLENGNGTAPGMWFEENGKVFVSMPGVPFEMKEITTNKVIPRLKQNFKLPSVIHRTIQTFGIPESLLANKIESWEKNLPKGIKLAYLPSPERVRLRLSTISDDKNATNLLYNELIVKLNALIGKAIFGYGDIFLEHTIGKLLTENKKTVSMAESCTGGNISRLITSVPGSSAYFEGGVVAYSNRIKNKILKVNNQTLMNFGAVSQETVSEMANGVRKLYASDYGIAVSGIAGPAGGSAEKPVGTVWIAVASDKKTVAKKYNFGERREITVRRASAKALDMLRKFMLGYTN